MKRNIEIDREVHFEFFYFLKKFRSVGSKIGGVGRKLVFLILFQGDFIFQDLLLFLEDFF